VIGANDVSQVNLRIVDNGTDGLVAWASCVVFHAIKLNNIAVRRGVDGTLFLTYPARRTPRGDTRQYFHPVSASAANCLRDAVVARLAALSDATTRGGSKNP
jgi:DNA-binding cell septation regulator SpoVG